VCLHCLCDFLSFNDLTYETNVLNDCNNEIITLNTSCISKTSTWY
jgi:hypothetical protein